MDIAAIKDIHKRHWKPGYGAVEPSELAFIQTLIATHKPRNFVEIGMASGMSTGFIATFLEDAGGESLLSLDHDDTFFGDKSKPNGFLVPEIYKGSRLAVDLVKFRTALDIQEFDRDFDMAFIDANHQHPWPALDMMALYPKMSGPRLMIHHDLRLFMTQDIMFGIGPKYLFDQFPDTHRIRSDANGGNIFAVSVDMAQERFEALLTDLLKLPWSLRTPLQPKYVDKIRAVIRQSYSDRLLAHFDRCVASYNVADRFRSGL